MKRVVRAGAKPVTALSMMLEWQRDWAARDTYDAVKHIVKSTLAHTGLARLSCPPSLGCRSRSGREGRKDGSRVAVGHRMYAG